MIRMSQTTAFTLVEIMCVIAILGILIAVVTPSIATAARKRIKDLSKPQR